MRKTVFAVVMSLFFASQAFADVTGAGDSMITLQLTKIYAILTTKYSAVLKTLQELKTQNAFLQNMVDKARMMKKEYDFVRNFRVENVINRVKNDFENLTLLDNLDGRSPEQQFEMMLTEIDRRFDKPNDEDEKMKKKLKGRVHELQRLQALLEAKLEEAKKLTKNDNNIKTIHNSIATTNCLLLSLEVQRQQRAILEQAQDINEEIEMESKVDDFQKALRKMGRGVASME